jgi:hypothetical protein
MDEDKIVEVIKKTFKGYYNQIQQQLYCTGLNGAWLVFLSVSSYNDEVNYNREISKNDIFEIRINRDEKVINEIKEKSKIFQDIRNLILNK